MELHPAPYYCYFKHTLNPSVSQKLNGSMINMQQIILHISCSFACELTQFMAVKADFVSAQRVHGRCKQIVWADRSCPQLKICYISVSLDINKCLTSNEVKMTMTTQKICVAIDRKRDIRSSVFLLYLLFLPGTDLSVSVN